MSHGWDKIAFRVIWMVISIFSDDISTGDEIFEDKYFFRSIEWACYRIILHMSLIKGLSEDWLEIIRSQKSINFARWIQGIEELWIKNEEFKEDPLCLRFHLFSRWVAFFLVFYDGEVHLCFQVPLIQYFRYFVSYHRGWYSHQIQHRKFHERESHQIVWVYGDWIGIRASSHREKVGHRR